MYRHHLVPTRPPEHGEEEIVAVFQQLSKFPLSVEDVGQLLVTDALPGDSLPLRPAGGLYDGAVMFLDRWIGQLTPQCLHRGESAFLVRSLAMSALAAAWVSCGVGCLAVGGSIENCG